VYDLTDPRRPKLIDTLATLDSAQAVTLVNGHAYIGFGSRGLSVFDVSDFSRPLALGNHNLPGRLVSIAASGGTLAAATHQGGLSVILAEEAPAATSLYLLASLAVLDLRPAGIEPGRWPEGLGCLGDA